MIFRLRTRQSDRPENIIIKIMPRLIRVAAVSDVPPGTAREVMAGDRVVARTFGTRGDVVSSPVISGGKVYVASKDKKLYVLDLQTGKKLGEFQARFAIEASPAIGQGVIVVGDGRGLVYCL